MAGKLYVNSRNVLNFARLKMTVNEITKRKIGNGFNIVVPIF